MTMGRPDDERQPRPRLTVQALFGLMVIAVGVLFTLDNLDVIDARAYLQYWPAGLVAIGLLKLYHAAREGQGWFGGLVFVSIGAWMLIEQIVYFRIDARDVMPLFLVFLGGYMVWRGFGGGRPPRRSDGQSNFSALAIMGGVVRRCNAQAFRGADLTAVMGGIKLDLADTRMEGDSATVEVFAFWGGIEIYVPPDWTVTSKVTTLLGGFVDKRRPTSVVPTKTLIVQGMVVMGGIEVKN